MRNRGQAKFQAIPYPVHHNIYAQNQENKAEWQMGEVTPRFC